MTITGIVKPHKGNGRKFGYPTANIQCPHDLEEGVFIGFSTLNFNELRFDTIPSIIFIGAPETLHETDKRLETHLFDIPDRDYYGAEVRVSIVEKLRDNQNFGDIETLIAQMHTDEKNARSWFRQNNS